MESVGERFGMLEVLREQANLAQVRGDCAGASSLLEQALALAISIGDTHDAAWCKMELGWNATLQGNAAKAEALLHESLAVQRQLADTNCTAISVGYLGMSALEREDVATAHDLLEQSLAGFEEVAARASITRTVSWLGAAHLVDGNVADAEADYLKSLRIERGLPNRQRTAALLEGLAAVAFRRGQLDRSAQLLGAAASVLGDLAPSPLPPRLAAQREHVPNQVRQALGEEAWTAAHASGQALSREEAIALALGEEKAAGTEIDG